MLGSALQRLLTSLDEAKERSTYEELLRSELAAIKESRYGVSERVLSSIQVDLGSEDILRLRCAKSDCPNKRL